MNFNHNVEFTWQLTASENSAIELAAITDLQLCKLPLVCQRESTNHINMLLEACCITAYNIVQLSSVKTNSNSSPRKTSIVGEGHFA